MPKVLRLSLGLLLSLSNLHQGHPPRLQESAATSIHEPHFEFWVALEHARHERLDDSLDVIRAEDGLLKALLKHVMQRQLKGLEAVVFGVIDEDDAMRGQDAPSLAFQLAHALDADVELNLISLKQEVLVLDPQRDAVRVERRI